LIGFPDISWTRDGPRAAEIPGMTINENLPIRIYIPTGDERDEKEKNLCFMTVIIK